MKFHLRHSLVFATLFFFPLLFIPSGLKAQNRKIDSLKHFLQGASADTNYINGLIALSHEYQFSDPDTTIILGREALSLAEKLNFSSGAGRANGKIGRGYYIKGDLITAREFYEKAKLIFEKLVQETDVDHRSHYLTMEGGMIGEIGTIQCEQGNYSGALICYFDALKIAEHIGIKRNQAIWLDNIGIVYDDQKQYDKAIDYYRKSLAINKETGDKNNIAIDLSNIACSLKNKNDFSEAIATSFASIKIMKEENDEYGIAINLSNIASAYDKMSELANDPIAKDSLSKRAIEYYLYSLKLSEENGDENGSAIILCSLGSLYLQLNDLTKAESSLKTALKVSEKNTAYHEMEMAHKYLSELYDKQGKYQLALYHFKRFKDASDSVTNKEQVRKQTQAELNYEFNKKEDIARIEQEKKDVVTKLIIYSVSGGLVLVLLLAIFILRSYIQKKRANVTIGLQKREVEKQKELVEEKQKEILDSIHYAKRIQRAILPKEKYIDKNFRRLRKI